MNLILEEEYTVHLNGPPQKRYIKNINNNPNINIKFEYNDFY